MFTTLPTISPARLELDEYTKIAKDNIAASISSSWGVM